jgi:glycosyltransferase involved in cell wall biosynthesis
MRSSMSLPVSVLMIGPSPQLMGGMSTVIGQMLRLDFAGRYALSALPITMTSGSGESGPRRIARHVGQRLLLGRMLRDSPATIVHIHTCSGFSFHRSAWDLRVARRQGCRTILHMHGAQFDEYFSRATKLEQRFIRLALTAADQVIALSDSWREKLRRIAPDARLAVIENAVQEVECKRRRPSRSVCRFLTLARMDVWKGIDDLLDASAILKRQGIPFELTLAGPPGSAGDAMILEKKIADRTLIGYVRYLGPAAGEAKATLLAESDVYVQPSHQEGMPLAVLEAFAHRLPVIVTRVGAMAEVVDHEVQGLVVPAWNPAALACAMGAIAIDPPRRLAMGGAGHELATTRFALTRFRDNLLGLYDELLRESVSRSKLTGTQPPFFRLAAARQGLQ